MNLLDLLFPPHCLGCRSPGSYLCPHCTNLFSPITSAICPVCGKGSYSGITHPRCRKSYTLDGLISTFPYQGIVKQALMKYKYKLVYSLTQTLHELIITHTDFSPISSRSWLITAVPLHPRRRRWRGFNQAELLTHALAQYTHWPHSPHLLKRTRYTTPQMSLSRSPRLKNLTNAFMVHAPPNPIPYSVLLVDDVWTTGATLSECAKVLKRAGAKTVWAYTLARTLNQ
jgi:competence protein ComFC